MAHRDTWAEWMANRRFGGDAGLATRMVEELGAIRDRVLENAALADGDVALDVGCGDGLIGLGALGRIGERGVVIFSDISQDLLDECRARAEEAVVAPQRCRYVLASADALVGIDDASVDAVLLRSVLIYVQDKETAFREFHRVLRPGGRLSLFEPINRFSQPMSRGTRFFGFELPHVAEIAGRVRSVFEERQPPDEDPMLDFDERDLVEAAVQAGFLPVRLELRADVKPIEPRPWETAINVARNPRIPTLDEAMQTALTHGERATLELALRPKIEKGEGTMWFAAAYLVATKPEA